MATTIEGRGTSLESLLEIRKTTELEVPKWLSLLFLDTVIQLRLVITISQREIGLCQQLTSTKLKRKYKAEAHLAPKLIQQQLQLEVKSTPLGGDLNISKGIRLLQTYIIHLGVPYLGMNRSRLTAVEVLGRWIMGL